MLFPFFVVVVCILFLNYLPYPSCEYTSPGATWKVQAELKGNTDHGLQLYTELTYIILSVNEKKA